MTENAYIHIPFCVKKCNYCAFTSFNKLTKKRDYLRALNCEIRSLYKGEKLKTLYIGGGTPSLLCVDEVENLLSLFNFDENTEITFEVNPNRLLPEYLAGLKKAGINRISIGAQVFDEKILKIIGRLHKPEDIISAVKNSRNAGFGNISLDLIYGLPEQTAEGFELSLKKTIELGVEHVSLYGLKIEENTPFYRKLPDNLPDDDAQADMYLILGEILKQAGYKKYEISNYAKKGFESKHNLNYWNAGTYYGFGCGACGYENGVRYENKRDLEKYIQNPLEKSQKTILSEKDMTEEKIFLGFRKTSGIDVSEIKQKFGFDFYQKYKLIVDDFIKNGFMYETDCGYALTDKGFLISNEILCEFLD